MKIPPGFETPGTKNQVCKLKRSLYGLKQSPRAWFERFTRVIQQQGYSQCQTDHTLFVKKSGGGKLSILIVYVDNIIVTGDFEEEMMNLKKTLAKEFEIKDLGNLRNFLGMEVARSSEGISVSQRKYVLDLLTDCGMLGCKPADTPMDTTHKLGMAEKGAPVDKGRCQRLIGKLMNDLREEHMEAVYRILWYLKLTPGKGLFFKKGSSREVEIYSDADWAGSVTDRRSTSGYCT